MDANRSVAKTGDQYLAQREGIQGGKTQEELEAQMGFLRKAPRKWIWHGQRRKREDWAYDGFGTPGGTYFCRATRALRSLCRRKWQSLPCITWAWFTKEMGHVTGWGGEGALLEAHGLLALSPVPQHCVTTTEFVPRDLSVFMNERRTPWVPFSSLVPWFSEIIFKAEKKKIE